jgi:hypothetical protein
VILVDGIAKDLFLGKHARPSELLEMTYRELRYFHDALVEDAKARKAD